MSRVCQWCAVRLTCWYVHVGSCAPLQAIGVVRQTGRGTALPLPLARRGYGYGSGSAVADGTAGVPVQACQGSCAPLQAIGMIRRNRF